MPVLSGGSGSVRHITIMAGATLTIGTGGTLNLHGDIYNSGAFNASAGSIHFRGATTQKIPSFTALDVVQDGAGLFLLGDAEILRELEMIKGNILLNGHTVSLSGTSTGSFASHIVMDNNSSVRVIGLAAGNNRFIPVGTSPGSYTPVSFAANSGHATDDFTITLKPGVFANGVSGDTYTRDIVNRTWYISENVPGGSNVDMSFGWMEMEEFPGFDRIRSQVIRLEANQWVGGPIATATGTALYTTTMPNVSSFTAFAVRSETLPIVKQGALYPNPASSELNVVVNLPAETQVVISIYDVKGSLMMKQQATVNAGLSRTMLDISRLYAGVYLLRVTGPSGEEVYAERFVKAR
jgi:hypothetical protein